MKMPENEPLRLVLNPNGQLFVDHGVTFSEYEAVELPEHGDLIDIRNAVNAMFALGNYHLNDYEKGWNDGIKAVIENAPVIVPSNKEDAE
jgi:hypothetical protein